MDGRKAPRTPAQIEATKRNLKPCRTHEEAVERGRRGGLAAAKANEERRNMALVIKKLLALPLRGDENLAELQSLADAVQRDGLKNKTANLTVAEAVLLAQVKEALNGSTAAARFIADLIPPTVEAVGDDGFVDALNGKADEDWKEGGDEPD